MADHTCTSLPLTVSIRARAMPQVPAPRTPIFCFVTFVSSVLHRAGPRPPVNLRLCPAKPGARCYVHCTRKRVPRQPLAALHKVFQMGRPFLFTLRDFSKPFALHPDSCYSILVGFVGIFAKALDFKHTPSCIIPLFLRFTKYLNNVLRTFFMFEALLIQPHGQRAVGGPAPHPDGRP